jgi:hypothetical protein
MAISKKAKKYSREKKLTKSRFLRELEQGYSIKNICKQKIFVSNGATSLSLPFIPGGGMTRNSMRL